MSEKHKLDSHQKYGALVNIELTFSETKLATRVFSPHVEFTIHYNTEERMPSADTTLR